jgi:tetratricopeptide (TPR) repeat protein
MRAVVLLECSRLEEACGRLDKARSILAKARAVCKHEWKVFLESVLLEMRAGSIDNAMREAENALRIHTGTGRLWAVMIQLQRGRASDSRQLAVFHRALTEVPKSGEVWCEGARIALRRGNLAEARTFLDYAIQFTPQYGDSFVEYMRLELLEHGRNARTRRLEQLCVNADPNYGLMWLHCKKHPVDSTRAVLRSARRLLLADFDRLNLPHYEHVLSLY